MAGVRDSCPIFGTNLLWNSNTSGSLNNCMTPRRIVLLGSTGSIGRSTLDVVKRHPGRFEVIALAAYSNAELLVEQYQQFRPEYVCLVDSNRSRLLAERLKDKPVKVLSGEAEMVQLDGDLRKAILSKADLDELESILTSRGHMSMAQDARRLVSRGITIQQEVEKVCGAG